MRVHVVDNAEEVQEPKTDTEAPKAKEKVPVPRFRSSWTGGTVLWSSEKTAPPGQVAWQWEHRTGFKAYDVRATARIEDAFQRGLSRVRLKAGKMDDTPMELFFHDMIQFDPKTGNTRKIRRVGRDSWWKRFRRKVNELAWLIETGRTQREKSFIVEWIAVTITSAICTKTAVASQQSPRATPSFWSRC